MLKPQSASQCPSASLTAFSPPPPWQTPSNSKHPALSMVQLRYQFFSSAGLIYPLAQCPTFIANLSSCCSFTQDSPSTFSMVIFYALSMPVPWWYVGNRLKHAKLRSSKNFHSLNLQTCHGTSHQLIHLRHTFNECFWSLASKIARGCGSVFRLGLQYETAKDLELVHRKNTTFSCCWTTLSLSISLKVVAHINNTEQ